RTLEEIDILQAIIVPFPDPSTQYFVTGFDGFPAFGFRAGANIKHPYRLFLPDKFYREFSIHVALKPDQSDLMFLFAVVNPLENLIQLGISIGADGGGNTNISLYYTDVEKHMSSQVVASFLVPEFTGKWTR
ncbi:Collagen alpha-1(XV) chain, partial [Armadillidium nasatum]